MRRHSTVSGSRQYLGVWEQTVLITRIPLQLPMCVHHRRRRRLTGSTAAANRPRHVAVYLIPYRTVPVPPTRRRVQVPVPYPVRYSW